MRLTSDATGEELLRVLDELLKLDVDVTAREVSRRHTSLKSPSAFTRNKARVALIEVARRRQLDARNVRRTPIAARVVTLAEQLKSKAGRVAELERQVSSLVASHAACVRAVMQHGGMESLQRFWFEYRAITESLESAGALTADSPAAPPALRANGKAKPAEY